MTEDRKLTDHSLYRYAGGKNRVKKEIIKHIFEVNPSMTKLVSPFFGGGSTEMLLASMGVEVKGYDFYKPLADFWEILQEEHGPQRLYSEIMKHYPLNVEDERVIELDPSGQPILHTNVYWTTVTPDGEKKKKVLDRAKTVKKAKNPEKVLDTDVCLPATTANSNNYKSYLPLLNSDDKFTRAWAFYVCIKGSYSGKIGCSTYLSRAEYRTVGLEKVRDYHNPNLSLEWGDCFDIIPKHQNDFLYLDPPYKDTVSYYYGEKGEHHKGFDHEKLVEVLREHKGGFVMSYDNNPSIKKLYKDFTDFRYIDMMYQMSGTKRFAKKELLIVKPSEVESVVRENERFRLIQKALAL